MLVKNLKVLSRTKIHIFADLEKFIENLKVFMKQAKLMELPNDVQIRSYITNFIANSKRNLWISNF